MPHKAIKENQRDVQLGRVKRSEAVQRAFRFREGIFFPWGFRVVRNPCNAKAFESYTVPFTSN